MSEGCTHLQITLLVCTWGRRLHRLSQGNLEACFGAWNWTDSLEPYSRSLITKSFPASPKGIKCNNLHHLRVFLFQHLRLRFWGELCQRVYLSWCKISLFKGRGWEVAVLLWHTRGLVGSCWPLGALQPPADSWHLVCLNPNTSALWRRRWTKYPTGVESERGM